jgi:hypothetical protein
MFSLGGGSFTEYESLKMVVEEVDDGEEGDGSQAQGLSKIVYGCDHVFTPQQFLTQILDLN